MKTIRLRQEALELRRKQLGLTRGALAARLGLSPVTLYRAGLAPGARGYEKPGERLITAVLTSLPGARFEEFFFFE